MNTIEGILATITEPTDIGNNPDRPFLKRQFTIEFDGGHNGEKEQTIEFEILGAQADTGAITTLREGDPVRVTYRIEGRPAPAGGRHLAYVNLKATDITRL